MKPRHLIPAVLCALLVAYPLSEGPLTFMYYKSGSVAPGWMQGFYSPLDWLCEQSETFNRFYSWYMMIWYKADGAEIPPPVS